MKPAPSPSPQSMLLPLILAQFIASYAGSNMNVAINSIAKELGTSVSGVQAAITFFTLVMAALMIPGSKLSDIRGRKTCFRLGLTVYGLGALIGAIAPGLGILILGYSIFEGIGSALMIPPIYILTTILITDLNARAKAFGSISAAAGVGSAAGPLIGGLITSTISWRASFIAQALVVLLIIYLSRRIADPVIKGAKHTFDTLGAILSALGLVFIVGGILLAQNYGWFVASQDFVIGTTVIISQGGISPVWLFVGIGAAFLLWFFLHIRARERAGKEPLLSIRLFKNKASNLGLITQNVQWLTLQGSFFVISVFLQVIRGFSAIQTGLVMTASTVGLLLSSTRAERMAIRFSQRTLIRIGFIMAIAGTALLLLLAGATTAVWTFLPGLFIIGAGVGIMLTSSVNVVQSSFPEKDQGEISGLSRSVSNLGSSLGVAIAGTILVSAISLGNKAYGAALIAMMVIEAIGLVAALLLPPDRPKTVTRAI